MEQQPNIERNPNTNQMPSELTSEAKKTIIKTLKMEGEKEVENRYKGTLLNGKNNQSNAAGA